MRCASSSLRTRVRGGRVTSVVASGTNVAREGEVPLRVTQPTHNRQAVTPEGEPLEDPPFDASYDRENPDKFRLPLDTDQILDRFEGVRGW